MAEPQPERRAAAAASAPAVRRSVPAPQTGPCARSSPPRAASAPAPPCRPGCAAAPACQGLHVRGKKGAGVWAAIPKQFCRGTYIHAQTRKRFSGGATAEVSAPTHPASTAPLRRIASTHIDALSVRPVKLAHQGLCRQPAQVGNSQRLASCVAQPRLALPWLHARLNLQ